MRHSPSLGAQRRVAGKIRGQRRVSTVQLNKDSALIYTITLQRNRDDGIDEVIE
jgi:hypothetical protein